MRENYIKKIINIKNIFAKVSDLRTGEDCIFPLEYDLPDYDLWCFQNVFLSGSKKELLAIPLNDKSNNNNKIVSIYINEKIDNIIFLNVKENPLKNISRISSSTISLEELYKKLIKWGNYIYYLKNDPDDNFETNNINNLFVSRAASCLNSPLVTKEKSEDGFLNVLSKWASSDNSSNNQILILGERGTGKSWLVKKFCLEQIKRHKSDVWLNPPAVYINLKIYQEYSGLHGIEKLIAYHIAKKYKISLYGEFNIFKAFVHTGNIILVLDGLDEMEQEMTQANLQRHIYELFNMFPSTAKVIITSRSSIFISRTEVFKYFARSSYSTYLKLSKNQQVEDISSNTLATISRDFSIYQLGNFTEEEYKKLVSDYTANKKYLYAKGLKRLNDILDQNNEYGSIFLSLSKVPAIQSYLQQVLSTEIKLDFIDILEEVILYCYIDYNILTGRALGNRPVRIDKGEKLNYFKEEKMILIQELAWYLFEKNERTFSAKLFPFKIRQIFGRTASIIENDIRTQTIFKPSNGSDKSVNSEGKKEDFEFILPAFFDYFVARHIYHQIKEKEKIKNKKKIYDFGRHKLTGEKSGKISIMLRSLLDKDEQTKDWIVEQIKKEIIEKPYSYWLRFAQENLQAIGISDDEINKSDFWQKSDIKIPDEMVLINPDPSVSDLDPYIIGAHEITNDDFEQFLQEDGKDLWDKRHIYNEDSQYSSLSNQYHLFHWKGDKKPIEEHDHPVVFVSWYTAADYCNWLTDKEFSEEDRCYEFEKNENKLIGWKVNFIADRKGYRLPTEKEWEYAARGGQYKNKYGKNIIYPWDLPESEYEKQKMKKIIMGEREKTIPVLSDEENAFGVSGMMGNVREWSNDWGDPNLKMKKVIRGSTATWGEDSFKFNNKIAIYRENTNHDVGFRVARSLDKKEKKVLSLYSYLDK